MNEKQPDNANVILLPPFIYLGFFIVGYVAHYFIRLRLVEQSRNGSILDIIGTAFVILALIIPFLAMRALEKFNTTHKVSEPTTAIVRSGVFQYSRNPIYLSGFILYAGLSFIINSLITLLLMVPLFFVVREGVVKREESYLERKFGQEYLSYKERVRRWI